MCSGIRLLGWNSGAEVGCLPGQWQRCYLFWPVYLLEPTGHIHFGLCTFTGSSLLTPESPMAYPRGRGRMYCITLNRLEILFWGHSIPDARHTAVPSPTKARISYGPVHFRYSRSKHLFLPLFLKFSKAASRKMVKAREGLSRLGVAQVKWGLQRIPSVFWECSGLRKSLPQNTESTFAQTKLSLVAEKRVALSSSVSVATLRLPMWELGWEEMAEQEK